MPTRTNIFTTIRTEGALLPPDLLQRIADGAPEGLTPADYHRPGEKLNEAINRAWNSLQGAWANFKAAQEKLPASDLGTSITRERWLLPLFRELDYGRLPTAPAMEIDGRTYPISHAWEGVPIHLVSYQLDLDRRAPGVAGASSASPHSLVQVFLNRSDDHLWGFVSNGYKLRILRDNVSLTRQAYVEFDLQAMMDGEVYADFVLLWLLGHQSRVEGDRPSDCWLERWAKTAQEQGTRALDQLRVSVEAAITALGVGFLEHPANTALCDRLQDNSLVNGLSAQDYYRQLLRLVYRLLFLFVAEDRDLLYDPAAPEANRQRYTDYYSSQRLRRIAGKLKGTRHHDLFEALRLVMRLLSGSSNGAGATLGLPTLGSFLFSDAAVPDLIECQIANMHLLDAVRALAFVEDKAVRLLRPTDFKNLGADEFGSVYESLLELHPQINVPARTFALTTASGSERKTTGSYYTPSSLINALLDSALDPVIKEAVSDQQSAVSKDKGKTAEERLLNLKVCDPACGSGHFLIAAAHRIARALAQARTGEEEPPPDATRHALRDVIGHCIYGVDINPMAVELCKVNLWMEALEPGKPLSFLDHRIQCGNSLLGTTPALMAQGIPDNAFNPIEGDDPKYVAALKRTNREERKQRQAQVRQLDLFGGASAADYRALTRALDELDAVPDDTLAGIRHKEAQYSALANDPEYVKARLLADAWCAAFVSDKVTQTTRVDNWTLEQGRLGVPVPTMTDLIYRRLESDPLAENMREIREYVVELTQRYQFFHWHVAFPDVFNVPDDPSQVENQQVGWSSGFDLMIGNPPWDMIQIDPEEYFVERAPNIAFAETTSLRNKMIEELKLTNPYLYYAYFAEIRRLAGIRNIINHSGLYALTSYGRLNISATFAELFRILINHKGFAGLIVPTGIATDAFNQYFFTDLVDKRQIVSLYDFENAVGLFPGIGHGRFKFCLLTLSGPYRFTGNSEFAFFARQVTDLKEHGRTFTLSSSDFALFNPNTLTCPIFRTRRDAELTKNIYQQRLVLVNEKTKTNVWHTQFKLMFMMNTASHLFRTRGELLSQDYELKGNVFLGSDVYVPLYEAKMFWHFDHRFGDYADYPEDAMTSQLPDVPVQRLMNPKYAIQPRYWVNMTDLGTLADGYEVQWFLVFRDITNATNERTAIFSILPRVAVANSAPLLLLEDPQNPTTTALLANLNNFLFDYVTRQKIGGTHMNFFVVKQLPVIPPDTYIPDLLDFIMPRVLELTYTAWDLQPFAQDFGWSGPPFIWDDERRFLMRCELDALYFHLYQISRDDVDYIMETFPIVKRKDEARHGEYLTKRIILEMYDQMAALPTMDVPAPKGEGTYAVPDVSQWVTWLNPPPADPSVAHSTT